MTPPVDVLVHELDAVLAHDPIDLAMAALVISKIECPDLDPQPYLDTLDRLGRRARARLDPHQSLRERVAALNALVFGDEGFAGDRAQYDDFRNSLLNVVLERRRGIPITLAVVYMEIAHRGGLEVEGISFPGRFLMRVSPGPGQAGEALVLDPFDGGTELDVADCHRLLANHAISTADEPFDLALLRPCTRRQIVARMLNNLKRTYVGQRAFARARRASSLLLRVDPMMLSELRDRGLLAYHLDDFSSALQDLEDYLRLLHRPEDSTKGERQQIVEHLKALRRRVASLN